MTRDRAGGPFGRGRRAIGWPDRGRRRPPGRFAIHAAEPHRPGDLPRPRLLACDIDGTILDDRGRLRPVVREALSAVTRSGVHVVLATGRSPWTGVAELTRILEIGGPQITMQGALIADPVTSAVRRARPLPDDVYRDALDFAGRMGIRPLASFLAASGDRLPNGLESYVDGALRSVRLGYEDEAAPNPGDRPMRVLLRTGPERHWSVRLAAAEAFLGRAAVVWSDASAVEILALGTNKGEALAWYAAGRGVALDEVAAVGDAANDIAMLRVAGRSAAMGSAPSEVRLAADVTVGPSRDDGVVDALRWFFPDLRDELGLSLLGGGLRLLS